MHAEHCTRPGSDYVFETPNYHFVTTAAQEWRIVVEGAECPAQNLKHGRDIKDLDRLIQLGKQQGNLRKEEVIAVVLYTGPMVGLSDRDLTVCRRGTDRLPRSWRSTFPTAQYSGATPKRPTIFSTESATSSPPPSTSSPALFRNYLARRESPRAACCTAGWGV